MGDAHGRETLLDTIEALRGQRDALYTQTVQPRRDVARALKCLHNGERSMIEDFLVDASAGLDSVAVLYREQTHD